MSVSTAPPSALTQQAADEIAAAFRAGRPAREIRDGLVSHGGVDPHSASEWVRAVGNAYADAFGKIAQRRMLYGLLWAGGGTAVTVFTYLNASAGGTYLVAWGAVIFGIVDILRGLFGLAKVSGVRNAVRAL